MHPIYDSHQIQFIYMNSRDTVTEQIICGMQYEVVTFRPKLGHCMLRINLPAYKSMLHAATEAAITNLSHFSTACV